MKAFRYALRKLIKWALNAPPPPQTSPSPELSPPQAAQLAALTTQYWQWELEGFKHIIVVAVAGLAGAATLGGAGLFKGNGDKLMWSIYGFSISLIFAYFAIFVGARSFEFAIQPSKSGAPQPPGKPSMIAPTMIGGTALIALVAGIGFMYVGALDGMIKQGIGGDSPPPEKTKYIVRCSTIEHPASSPAVHGRHSQGARGKVGEMSCQISS